MLTEIEYQLLKTFFPHGSTNPERQAPAPPRLGTLLGDELLDRVRGATVIDFGCGEGSESIELARAGARSVIGIDIRENVLAVARGNATMAGFGDRCRFTTDTSGIKAELIVSIDAFEHFSDPAFILRKMDELLVDSGELITSFGPTWFHPSGGHLFSVFPWAHLLFTEQALIRWRSDFKTDGAKSFGEVEGGLNQISIARFERIVSQSPFRFLKIEAVPIRRLRPLHNRWTREFTTAIIRCRLVKRAPAAMSAAAAH